METQVHRPHRGTQTSPRPSSVNWNREDIAWAAGLFEGEGTISFCRPRNPSQKNHWALVVAMTDEDVIRRFHAIVGMGVVSNRTPRPDELGKQVIWKWRMQSHPMVMYALLVALWPWIGERRRVKIRELVRFCLVGDEPVVDVNRPGKGRKPRPVDPVGI